MLKIVNFIILIAISLFIFKQNIWQESKCEVLNKNNHRQTFNINTSCGNFNINNDDLNGLDMYNSIEINKTYTFLTYGYKLNMLNIYPNIIKFRSEI